MNRITLEKLAACPEGTELGSSPWITVSQDMIQSFADLTGDHQWIHVDPERARRESPWKTTVAHGFLTLSLIPRLNTQVLQVTGIRATINYGLNRVRFLAPVPRGSDIRSHMQLKSIEHSGNNRWLATYQTTVEIRGGERPACVAENLALYLA